MFVSVICIYNAVIALTGCKGAGEMTNIQSRTTDPEDSRLMKLVEKKHRQEMKMARMSPLQTLMNLGSHAQTRSCIQRTSHTIML